MAVMRDRPYGQFNFLVDLGDGNTEGPDAGFQECSPITTNLVVMEYRNGNDRENSVRKLTGLERVDDVRNGDVGAYRNVTISLQNEDHTAVVMTWKLLRARPAKWSSGPLNAKGTDVAMEELTLAYERLEVE